jgi:uncharacterized glyoxalase superfamily protein PhnB
MEFLKYVFDAEEREKMTQPDRTVNHGEVSIGNSVILMGKAAEHHTPQTTMSISMSRAQTPLTSSQLKKVLFPLWKLPTSFTETALRM